MEKDEYLIKQIQKGIDAENLINNNVWKEVIISLQDEMLNATMQLSTKVDSKDSDKIQELQNTIYRYTGLVTRVSEIIQEAKFKKEEEMQLNE